MTSPAGRSASARAWLQLDDGDLVFDDQASDLAMVTDTGALTQALIMSIETQLGSDRINSGFGFDRAAVGAYAYGIHTQKEYVKMQLVRCVGLDRRVKDVREAFFQDDPRYFELNPGLGRRRAAADSRSGQDQPRIHGLRDRRDDQQRHGDTSSGRDPWLTRTSSG